MILIEKVIGTIIYNGKEVNIHPSYHTRQFRKNQSQPRDSLSDKEKIEIIDKTKDNLKNGTVSVVYKKDDYYVGLAYAISKGGNKITIITIINSKSNTKETDIWKNKENRVLIKD